jgi:hypothetical protein
MLEEDLPLVVHRHGGDARVHHVHPRAVGDENLWELVGGTEGRERLLAQRNSRTR